MDDLISRQAAIDALEKVAELYPWRVPGNRDSYSQYNEAWQDALNRADSEIEALPSAQPETHEKRTETHACDSISRQAAIDAIERNAYRHTYIDQIVDIIKELPSAQPQITHCAECMHWKHSDVRKSYCEVFDWMNRAEDFCSFAERRPDGN